MKIELTREQLYNLLFELIVAKSEEQSRLERCYTLKCSADVIKYQLKCVERTEELIELIDKAIHTPFD